MKKKATALIFLLICFLALSALAEGSDSELSRHMSLYGYDLPEDIVGRMHEAFSPVSIDCGEVTVSLDEVLYDGHWLYVSARAAPNDAQAVLLLPGSAWIDDLVRGGYGENDRDDARTFMEAAREDGKRLLAIYAYPAEFEALPEYFLDHFQRAEDVSVLFGGGILDANGAAGKDITWRITIYEVNLENGEFDLENATEKTYAATIAALGPTKTTVYIDEEGTSPISSVALLQTALATYVQAEWRDEDSFHSYHYWPLDPDGNPYPKGPPPEHYTFAIEELPQLLTLQIENEETGEKALHSLQAVPQAR